jgi:aerobic carbon-monoxide dehydrogenase large subunit
MKSHGVGATIPRVEDLALMRGNAKFVADIASDQVLDLAFLRSSVPRARILGIEISPVDRPFVVTADDLGGLNALTTPCAIEGFKAAYQPFLAKDATCYAGEPIAAAFGPSRAIAEDIVGRINLRIDPQIPLLDVEAALAAGAPHVHESWPDNLHATSVTGTDAVSIGAPRTVRRTFRTSRLCTAALENRGILAEWDAAIDQLVVHVSTQAPHVCRSAIADTLGLEERRIRVVAPAVGGGFGYKGVVLPEEILTCWLAATRKRPFRWLQDRRENLVTSMSSREYVGDISAHIDDCGRILGLSGTVAADAGAYSAYPFTAALEGLQLGTLLSGPYDVGSYRVSAAAAATNKPPAMPFRGTARPGGCFFTELMVDAIAREVNREPWHVRYDNLVTVGQMPYTNIVGKLYDGGDYQACLRRAVEMIDPDRVRAQQAKESGAIRIGVGFAFYCEQAAYGAGAYAKLGLPIAPGYEVCYLRMLIDGGLEIRTGVQSHGQGMETTLAQVAQESLGLPISSIKVIHGDTADTPYSPGTFGSRVMVVVGGAVHNACRELVERIRKIAAPLLQVEPSQVTVKDGRAQSGSASLALAEIADIWYRRPHELGEGVDPAGLDVIASYKPDPDSGTYSYGCHAAVVSVDLWTGSVKINDYVAVLDAGRLINPGIVEGQLVGGIAQGISSALFEGGRFGPTGVETDSLWTYMLPSAADIPSIRCCFMETPSPYTSFGQKGMGEGGAIPAAAAIANAINDALRSFDVEFATLPITADMIRAVLARDEA